MTNVMLSFASVFYANIIAYMFEKNGDFCNIHPVSAFGIVYLHYYLDNNNGFLYLYLGDENND